MNGCNDIKLDSKTNHAGLNICFYNYAADGGEKKKPKQ